MPTCATPFDPLTEPSFSFSQMAERLSRTTVLRAGKRVSFSTVSRWHKVGLRGVRLEAWHVGGRLVTTDSAITRFFTAVDEAYRVKEACHAC